MYTNLFIFHASCVDPHNVLAYCILVFPGFLWVTYLLIHTILDLFLYFLLLL